MIAAFDVQYINDTATTACLCFENWTDTISTQEFIEQTNNIAPYQPGEFYKRELPCLISLLEKHNLQPQTIVIDGYVWLEENKIGLGGHLYNALNKQVAVIGVAKSKFKPNPQVTEVFRGSSQNPLYVSSIGIELSSAVQNIELMAGEFRIPTLLKRVDGLCREIIKPNQ